MRKTPLVRFAVLLLFSTAFVSPELKAQNLKENPELDQKVEAFPGE
jgi:hypothetical protein